MNVKKATEEISKCKRYMETIHEELLKIDGCINAEHTITIPAIMGSDIAGYLQEYAGVLEHAEVKMWYSRMSEG